MPKSNSEFCPVCGGIGEVKIIKNIAQIGPYHLGKESWEKCNFCTTESKIKSKNNINERILH